MQIIQILSGPHVPVFNNMVQLREYISTVHIAAKQTIELLNFLEIEKFTVLGIDIKDRRTPMVYIANSARCAWLKKNHGAYTFGRANDENGHVIVWRCDLMGCRVQWNERGH